MLAQLNDSRQVGTILWNRGSCRVQRIITRATPKPSTNSSPHRHDGYARSSKQIVQ